MSNATLAEQLQALKPTHVPTFTPVIPLPRREAQRAAIEAVPVTRKHPRTLERFKRKNRPLVTSRERTTWRRVKAAAPALLTKDFPHYNEALEYSRSIGGHKPMRMEFGAFWRVVSPNLKPTQAEWVNVGPWTPPLRWSYCDPSSIAETLDAIPDFSEA